MVRNFTVQENKIISEAEIELISFDLARRMNKCQLRK